MRYKNLLACCAGLTVLILLMLTTAQASTMSSQSGVLTVTETVQGNTYKTTAVQNPMSDVAGVRRPAANGGTQVRVASPPWSPWTGSTSYSNDTNVQNNIGKYLASYADKAAQRVCKLLNSKVSRSHLALVSYYEPIKVNGKSAVVEGTLWVRDDCSHEFMGAEVVNSLMRIIYAIYTQGAVQQGLPKGWTMPNPGQLRWEMMEVSTVNTASTPQPVKINGKIWHDDDYLCSSTDTTSLCPSHNDGPLGAYGWYDEPQIIVNSKNKKVFYHCKKSSVDVCNLFGPKNTTPATDSSGNQVQGAPYVGRDKLVASVIRPLMQKYNAQYTLLDYGRTVQPVYKTDASGKQKPVVAVNVKSRILKTAKNYFFISPGGSAHFKNSGEKGYLLNYSFNRSLIQQGKSGIQTIQNTVEHKISPQQPYTKSVVANAGGPSYYQPRIIDPFQTSKVYPWKNDTVNGLPQSDYVNVAPLKVQ